jgi:hypothetical protein
MLAAFRRPTEIAIKSVPAFQDDRNFSIILPVLTAACDKYLADDNFCLSFSRIKIHLRYANFIPLYS